MSSLARRLDVSVLRGVALPTLMHNYCELFRDHGATARMDPAATFAKSREVEELSAFVSHAWRSPRFHKYLALLFHYNLGVALAAMGIWCAVCFPIECLYHGILWLPATRLPFHISATRGGDFVIPTGCTVGSQIIFWMVLLHGHRLGRSATHLFLDIACIRQDDPDAKAEGILALGATLDRSARMLVLFDHNYCTRLWTLFEVAAFHRRAGFERFDILPLHVPLLTLSLLLFGTLALMVTLSPLGDHLVGYLPLMLMQLLPLLTMGQYHDERHALDGLRRFSLDSAECYGENDRAAILNLIGKWFEDRVSAEVDPQRRQEEGHREFERLIRYPLVEQIRRTQPGLHLPVPTRTRQLFEFVCLVPIALDYCASQHVTLQQALKCLLYLLVALAAMLPAWSRMLGAASGCVEYLRRRGWSDWAAYALGLCVLNVANLLIALLALLFVAPDRLEGGADRTHFEALMADDGLDLSTRRSLKILGAAFLTCGGVVMQGERLSY